MKKKRYWIPNPNGRSGGRSEPDKIFIRLVQLAFKQHKMSAADFSRECKVPHPMVSQILRELRSATLGTAAKIAKRFDIDLNEIKRGVK